jgi:hypothetical protein
MDNSVFDIQLIAHVVDQAPDIELGEDGAIASEHALNETGPILLRHIQSPFLNRIE